MNIIRNGTESFNFKDQRRRMIRTAKAVKKNKLFVAHMGKLGDQDRTPDYYDILETGSLIYKFHRKQGTNELTSMQYVIPEAIAHLIGSRDSLQDNVDQIKNIITKQNGSLIPEYKKLEGRYVTVHDVMRRDAFIQSHEDADLFAQMYMDYWNTCTDKNVWFSLEDLARHIKLPKGFDERVCRYLAGVALAGFDEGDKAVIKPIKGTHRYINDYLIPETYEIFNLHPEYNNKFTNPEIILDSIAVRSLLDRIMDKTIVQGKKRYGGISNNTLMKYKDEELAEEVARDAIIAGTIAMMGLKVGNEGVTVDGRSQEHGLNYLEKLSRKNEYTPRRVGKELQYGRADVNRMRKSEIFEGGLFVNPNQAKRVARYF